MAATARHLTDTAVRHAMRRHYRWRMPQWMRTAGTAVVVLLAAWVVLVGFLVGAGR